jgi:putative acetyltransferase
LTGTVGKVDIRRAETPDDFAQVRRLGEAYAAWDAEQSERLGLSAAELLSFQHDYRVDTLMGRYVGGADVMLVAVDGDRVLGMGALIGVGTELVEIKTLYVDPAARGQHIGERILQALIALAKDHSCRLLRIETVTFMDHAIRLYERTGFRRCNPYYAIPESFLPITVFMDIALDPSD